MHMHLFGFLRDSFSQSQRKRNVRSAKSRRNRRGRLLAMETLEPRQMLSITTLGSINSSENTGEKPQSKVFEYAGKWWSVMPNSSGTSVYRLDGTSWTDTYRISENSSVHADVKLVGDLAHVLLFDGTSTQIASLQYDAGPDNRFEPWSLRPQLVSVPLSSSAETATIEVDSTGRMWVASDVSSTVEVRYSDGLYTSWSAPITVASGISSDDISSIIAMPNNRIGVFWSNQSTEFFGFRTHEDGAEPTAWSADERPASQSALNVGGGMADDHLHLAATSDGTMYAAVKTSYDNSNYPKIGLLVRRPHGSWDHLYSIDNGGTRPVLIASEAAGKLVVAYTANEGGGNILYRESPLGSINFSPIQVLMGGSENNVTTAKTTSNNQAVFMAGGKSVLYTFSGPPTNVAPTVIAGPDTTATVDVAKMLSGTVGDDGLPTPAQLSVAWSVLSGPGAVTFGNSALAATTATFASAGTYLLQLAANDGLLTSTDQLSIVVSAPGGDPPPPPPPPGEGGSTPSQIAFQNGLFPNVSYAGTIDTKIATKKPTKNYGNDSKMAIDGSPDIAGLFKWDISAIPVGSTVESVAIELNVTGSSKDSYEVYSLQRAWSELEATWQRYAAGNNWAGAGATGSGDQASTVLGQLAATNKGTSRINLNAAGVAAVQNWVNDAGQNFGIIIKDFAVSKAVEVSTSEAKTASQRPKLIINYKTPPVNVAPVVEITTIPSGTIAVGQPLVLGATVADDGLPTSGPALAAVWTQESGPGIATFGDSQQVDTTVEFDTPGEYRLRLTVTDSLLNGFDELLVSVT
ncbi:MAG: DNRLRE domain-containing protein [Pirellulales bacterium]|nr:DNRLRE domain-containing protein [Pirellulales bacterium]